MSGMVCAVLADGHGALMRARKVVARREDFAHGADRGNLFEGTVNEAHGGGATVL